MKLYDDDALEGDMELEQLEEDFKPAGMLSYYVYVKKYNPNGACLKVPNTYLYVLFHTVLRCKIILTYL